MFGQEQSFLLWLTPRLVSQAVYFQFFSNENCADGFNVFTRSQHHFADLDAEKGLYNAMRMIEKSTCIKFEEIPTVKSLTNFKRQYVIFSSIGDW